MDGTVRLCHGSSTLNIIFFLFCLKIYSLFFFITRTKQDKVFPLCSNFQSSLPFCQFSIFPRSLIGFRSDSPWRAPLPPPPVPPAHRVRGAPSTPRLFSPVQVGPPGPNRTVFGAPQAFSAAPGVVGLCANPQLWFVIPLFST